MATVFAMPLKCSPFWEPRHLRQDDDQTSLRLLASGARLGELEISGARRLLSFPLGHCSCSRPQKTTSCCWAVCVGLMQCQLFGLRVTFSLTEEAIHFGVQQCPSETPAWPRAKAADSLRSLCLLLSLRRPWVASGPPLADFPVPHGRSPFTQNVDCTGFAQSFLFHFGEMFSCGALLRSRDRGRPSRPCNRDGLRAGRSIPSQPPLLLSRGERRSARDTQRSRAQRANELENRLGHSGGAHDLRWELLG